MPSSLERRVTLIAAVGTFALVVVMFPDASDHGLVLFLFVTAVAYLTGYLTRRRVLVPVNVIALVLMIASGSQAPSAEQGAATYVGFSVVASILATFAERFARSLVALTAVAGMAVAYVWSGSTVVALNTGIAAGFVGLLIAALRSNVESALARAEAILDRTPVAIMEQDWSEVRAGLDELRARGVQDLDDYLDRHPQVVADLISKVDLRFANREALDMYRATSFGQVRQRFAARRDTTSFVNDRSAAAYRRYLLALWGGSVATDEEIHTYRLDGRDLWGRVRWSPHPDGQDVRIVAVNDITELKEVQSELEDANRSKDRFVASVSHELRTPLAAVLGFSTEIVERGEDFEDSETTEMLEVIRSEAREASNIIEDLLVAARADIGGVVVAHEETDVVSVARGVVRSSGLDIHFETDSPEVLVCGDAGRIRQVLRNLVSNAGRYGGPDLWVTVRRSDDAVSVEVADDGGSLTEADLERIFQPYTRAHATLERTESVGLGLTVSKSLAELMSGALSARLEDTRTIFELRLPQVGRCPGRAAFERDMAASS